MRVPSKRNFWVLFLVICGIAFSEDRQARISRVENGLMSPVRIKGDKGWNILDRMKFYRVPGVSVAVFDDHRVVWTKGYGVADVETGEPVTENSLHRRLGQQTGRCDGSAPSGSGRKALAR